MGVPSTGASSCSAAALCAAWPALGAAPVGFCARSARQVFRSREKQKAGSSGGVEACSQRETRESRRARVGAKPRVAADGMGKIQIVGERLQTPTHSRTHARGSAAAFMPCLIACGGRRRPGGSPPPPPPHSHSPAPRAPAAAALSQQLRPPARQRSPTRSAPRATPAGPAAARQPGRAPRKEEPPSAKKDDLHTLRCIQGRPPKSPRSAPLAGRLLPGRPVGFLIA